VLQAIALSGHFPPPLEGQSSSIHIVNNTLYSRGDPNYGIWVAEDFGTPVVVANNAIGNLGQPFFGPVTTFSNVVASEGAESWFEAGATDYTPSADSPLRGAADHDYLPSHDFSGRKRTSNDVGAVAYH
jgi:hypothetical protein